MHGIEEGLDVHAAFLPVARKHLDEAARKLLAVEGFRMEGGSVIEIEFFGNLLDARVQKHILLVQNYNRVDDVLKVSDLMGGNHYD